MFDFGFHFFGNSSGGVVPPPPSTDFIIKVKTDNDGTSDNDQFTLPTSTGTYDYTIDWGDGVVEDINVSTSQTHTYPTAGEYTIKISGTFPRIHFNNGGDKLKLIETVNFGDVGWTSMNTSFWGCENMDISPTCTGVLLGVGNFFAAWQNCSSITSFPSLDLSGGTGFQQAWFNCTSMTSFNATALGSGTYRNTWRNCSSLTSFPSLDLSGGTNFDSTWSGCSSMTSFNATALGSGSYSTAWVNCSSMTSFPALDLSGGTSYDQTWRGCSSMTSFNATALGSGTMRFAWNGCSSLTSFPALDLSGGNDFNSTWRNIGVLTSFATRNFFNMTNGTNCFLGTTLPTADCSDIYITQRANNDNTGVSFHLGNSKYNPAGGVARGELVTIQSWSITDGGAE